METHHPHHVTHKKKWTEYLLEFFMLFLAVFLGFVAENIRENIVEHRRAKTFAQSIYNDITQDTAALQKRISGSEARLKDLDSAIMMLNTSPLLWNDTIIYQKVLRILTYNPFLRTSATYDQMKSSGSLRYFDQSLVDSLNTYDVIAHRLDDREKIDLDFQLNVAVPYLSKLINLKVLLNNISNIPIHNRFYFKRKDQNTIDELANLTVISRITRDRSLFLYRILLKKGAELLIKLSHEYAL